ncbi:MAG: TldD/PmbA family protein, partial [Candidatus Hodarchaeota archaeon]
VLKNGNPELGGFGRSAGIGIRVLAGGGLGFSSTNDLSKQAVEKAILEAVKIAKATGRVNKTPIQFSEEKFTEARFKAKTRENPADLDPDTKMSLTFEIDNSLKTSNLPFRIVVLGDSITSKYLVSNEGAKIESYVPRLTIFGVVTAVGSAGGMEQAYIQKGASGGYEWIKKWNLAEMLSEEAKLLNKVANEAKKPPKNTTLDFVIGAEVAGIVSHENCGHPSEADRILGREAAQAGESFLGVDKLGTRIGSDAVTIIDDPTIEGSNGFYLYDDEGVKAQPRYLIKNGIFNEMLHNRESAFVLETQSTAASRAIGWNREPIIRMANTYFAPGDYTEEEIFEDIKLGIYMVNFHEWNIDDRRYQSKYVGRVAYLIKNGEVTDQLLRRPPLETTTPDLFNAVDACAKDTAFDAALCGKSDPMQACPVWHGGSKAVRLRNIQIN